MGIAGTVAVLALAYEGLIQASETMERHVYYGRSLDYCRRLGKPLLRIGVRRSVLEPPNGDVTLDIDPVVKLIPGGVCGDVRAMPFASKRFGVAFCEHVLEHLHTAADVDLAVRECVRVAERAVFLCPSPYSLWSNFFCQTHYLRIWFAPSTQQIVATPNHLRTGLGVNAPAIMGQALVSAHLEPTVYGGSL